MDETLESTLSEHLNFLQKYAFLSNFPMTDVLSVDAIQQISIDWKESWLQMISSDANIVSFESSDCDSLTTFLKDCTRFSLDSDTYCRMAFDVPKEDSTNIADLKSEFISKFSIDKKKEHEIVELAALVNAIGNDVNASQILDIGAGVAYVDLLLHKFYGYTIYAAEKNPGFIESSKRAKQKVLGKDSCDRFKSIELNLTDDQFTTLRIQEEIDICTKALCTCNAQKCTTSETGPIAIGLHACGDLSVIILNLFLKIDLIKSTIVLPCCYHKMSHCTNNFHNYPLSSIISGMNKDISVYTMRLAAEEDLCKIAMLKTSEFLENIKQITYRAVIEDVCKQNGILFKKTRRRCVRKTEFRTFEEYIKIALKYSTLSYIDSSDTVDQLYFEQLLNVHYSEIVDLVPYVGLLRVLQLCIRPCIETILHLDKVIYLKEKGYQKCGFVNLFEKFISARSVAIVAVKS